MVGLAVLVAACGDPRTPFVGSYKGTLTQTTSFSNAPPDVSTDNITFTLTAPDHSDRLQFSSNCMFTAKVVSGDTFQFDPIACPTHRSTSVSGVAADYTLTIKSGTGTLTNKTLSITQEGEELGSNYADGSPNARYPEKFDITATKQ